MDSKITQQILESMREQEPQIGVKILAALLMSYSSTESEVKARYLEQKIDKLLSSMTTPVFKQD